MAHVLFVMFFCFAFYFAIPSSFISHSVYDFAFALMHLSFTFRFSCLTIRNILFYVLLSASRVLAHLHLGVCTYVARLSTSPTGVFEHWLYVSFFSIISNSYGFVCFVLRSLSSITVDKFPRL
uniref:Putative secreted peptide n=1 Tax=Anopheles braziliensis TaxID=58242 RepID=A0A2M3ZT85_9DIPT